MKIVFLGSADFGIAALQELIKLHTVVGVVSTPSRPKGRGLKLVESPVTSFARKEALAPIITPDTLGDPALVAQLKALEADCFVVVAFRLLPKTIFAIPKYGTLNIHASMLPKFRGPAPIHRAIEAGERQTGVTVFRIDEGVDTGEILQQSSIAIGEDETTPELYGRLSELGAKTLISTLDHLAAGTCAPIEQKSQTGSKAPKLKKTEGLLDWHLPAYTLFNKIRAFKPFPGTYALFHGKRIGVEWAEPLHDSTATCQPGTVVKINKDSLDIQTGEGQLRIRMLKPEGKKSMAAGDYIRGSRLSEGDYFNE